MNSWPAPANDPSQDMATSPGPEVPSHRACAHCRSQKVRCIPDDVNPDLCQRCARAGRPCVFTPLQKRKQRKRTDTRVAELEKEMRAMRSMLKKKQETTISRTSSPQAEDISLRKPRGIWFSESADDSSSNSTKMTQSTTLTDPKYRPPSSSQLPDSIASAKLPLWPTRWPDRPREQRPPDVVDRGVLSMATARQLYLVYRDDLFPHYPMVAIPDNVSADEMRESKPTLFLSIIAAAAGKENMELASLLDQEVLQAYATRSLMQSEKSLELVQALLISAVWYHPPQKFGQLKYYEYIHMAATMAMDIGIGSRPSAHRGRSRRDVSDTHRQTRAIQASDDTSTNQPTSAKVRSRDSSPESCNLESRRTFLACYIICSSVSVSLRRPNMLRASSYMRESVEYLERAADQIATDRSLALWARLMMIADEISVSFCYDDPGGVASIADLSTQLMIKDYRARLTTWANDLENNATTGSLTIMYLTVRLYLHEVALHVEHSPEDFKAPYQMGVIQVKDDHEQIPTQILVEALCECITAAQALLDTFTTMDPGKLRALPVFSFVRVSFGAFVLVKLTLSASSPGSRIAQVLDIGSVRAEEFIDRAIAHARKVIGNKRCRTPAIFLALLFKLRQWSRNPEIINKMIAEAANVSSPDESQADVLERNGMRMRQIEGPRVIEQTSSSSESSPQAGDIYQSLYSTGSPCGVEAVWKEVQRASLDSPGTQQQQSPSYDALGNGSLPGLPKFDVTSQPSYFTQPSTYMDGNDPMQLDPELLQLWNDVNGGGMSSFPEGGLTGLEDWSDVPLQMMGLGVGAGDGLGWQTQLQQQQVSNQADPNPRVGNAGGMNFG